MYLISLIKKLDNLGEYFTSALTFYVTFFCFYFAGSAKKCGILQKKWQQKSANLFLIFENHENTINIHYIKILDHLNNFWATYSRFYIYFCPFWPI